MFTYLTTTSNYAANQKETHKDCFPDNKLCARRKIQAKAMVWRAKQDKSEVGQKECIANGPGERVFLFLVCFKRRTTSTKPASDCQIINQPSFFSFVFPALATRATGEVSFFFFFFDFGNEKGKEIEVSTSCQTSIGRGEGRWNGRSAGRQI